MEETGSNCAIQRIGTILELGEEKAIIRINGKPLIIPIDKLASDLSVLDEVKWSGSRWISTKAESNAGNLKKRE